MSDAEHLQELVDGLATRIARPVLLDDPRLRLIAFSAFTGADEDVDPVRLRSILRRESPEDVRTWLFDHGLHELRAPAVLPPVDDLGMRERVCCPVRHEDVLLGYLWVLGTGDGVVEAAAPVADAAGVVLYRRRLEDAAARAEEVAALEALLAGGAATAPVVVLRTTGCDETAVVDRQAALEHALRRRTGGAGGRCLRRPDELVLAGAPLEDLRAAALAGAHGLAAGSGPTASEARRAALVAALCGRSGVVAIADVPLEAQVLAAAGDDPARVVVPAVAARLLAADAGLAATVEAYLDHGGDIAASTAALSVSRAGLYRRLHRAEVAAGADLRDGAQRTLLHLGLKAARLRPCD